MFANLHDLMSTAADRRLCLPALDIGGGQSDFLQGILAACEAARCPAVLLVWAPGATYLGLEACVDLVASFARRASVPVVLHLDHGKDAQTVSHALELGFTSVMFDGSEHPLDENIRRTRAMAELAHARGATIEGELGSFGQEQAAAAGDSHLADPAEAGRFVAETGVDLLAPAVGNAHGFYKSPPRLRFELIERIAAATGVPLSLHGGTGIPFADVRRAGELGMRKINIASQLHRDFSQALQAAAVEGAGWHKVLRAGREAIRQRAAEIIHELGVEGLL
ncbi:MAG TPA: class II fructose-bisphosphate aldolase [Phycisphaerae bacterium]|nr:class II fructose-bisphosphate aldolase [Phycisphaerae bacterium]